MGKVGESRDDEEFAEDETPSDERDDPQDRDVAEFGDDDSQDAIPCPACGKLVWEMADRCSFCGEWLSPEKPIVGNRTLLIAGVLIVLMLAAAFFVI